MTCAVGQHSRVDFSPGEIVTDIDPWMNSGTTPGSQQNARWLTRERGRVMKSSLVAKGIMAEKNEKAQC